MGFDEDFFKKQNSFSNDKVVHFGLMGKFEKRKHTEKIVKLWTSKYGNDNRYQLTICVTNPFMKPEEMNQIYHQIFESKRYKIAILVATPFNT